MALLPNQLTTELRLQYLKCFLPGFIGPKLVGIEITPQRESRFTTEHTQSTGLFRIRLLDMSTDQRFSVISVSSVVNGFRSQACR